MEIDEELLRVLAGKTDENGFLARKDLPDGRLVALVPLTTYGRARITLSETGSEAIYEKSWWYDHPMDALQAMREWDPKKSPEPQGWMRSPETGRRRPGGDPSQEYIHW